MNTFKVLHHFEIFSVYVALRGLLSFFIFYHAHEKLNRDAPRERSNYLYSVQLPHSGLLYPQERGVK